MADWDVFHSDRLEAERSRSTEQVRDALARGDLVEDDLIRPAGSARWARIGDSPDFAAGGPFAPPPAFEPPSVDEDEVSPSQSDLTRFGVNPESLGDFEPIPAPTPRPADPTRQPSSIDAFPVLADDETEGPDLPELVEEGEDEFDPQDEDEEAAEFTLSRNSAERVEELDLAAMVDVAFQLVLFFLVTATTVVFKTLEVPRPNEDKPPEAAAQARTRSIDELKDDYILVEVNAAGTVKVNRQPAPADRDGLTRALRAARESTGRKAMLLSADFATPHKNAVLVFDVANEVELQIAIAQPVGKK